MIGISHISRFLPETKIDNIEFSKKYGLEPSFVTDKIGVRWRRRKDEIHKSSDLCVFAFEVLKKEYEIELSEIDCCVVVTQNPDFNLPHTSAIVHEKLGLPLECACFDVSLGCSGYVYGLSIIKSFMEANSLKKGLLFTADPYSDIIDEDDKNTTLIFGDGATVSVIEEDSQFEFSKFKFGTNGKGYKDLINEEKLYMNGRAVFNFTAKVIPQEIKALMEELNLKEGDISKYILHQGSKYIVDTITKRLQVTDKNKVVFDMIDYGNLVSSSIPFILAKEMKNPDNDRFLLSGFGVGLSWGTTVLERKKLNK